MPDALSATDWAALSVLAVAPQSLGGVCLRAPAGPARDAWLAALCALLPPALPWRRMPAHISDEALLGALDLTATLAAGRPVNQAGLLAQAQGGVVLAAMAERIGPALASRLAAALDRGADLAFVALDEGVDDDETAPASLQDRLALQVTLLPKRTVFQPTNVFSEDNPSELVHELVSDLVNVERARATWRSVTVEDALVEALVAAAAALGVSSLRAACHAVTVLRIAAALDGRSHATADDAALAAQLVLAPRATQQPVAASAEQDEPQDAPNDAPADPPSPGALNEPEPPAQADDSDSAGDAEQAPNQALDERLIQAALAALPPGLLALLAAGKGAGPRRGDAGRSGQATRSQQRGRSIGAQRGEPRGGARLALIDTLRAAAPWQRVRRAAAQQAQQVMQVLQLAPSEEANSKISVLSPSQDEVVPQRVFITRDDLRIQRRVQRRATTTIFAIDASGSQALHRLAEAKGAVELLLADCYARRDRVAVIGFRGAAAQVLLPPTRSLVRAKRQLSGLPGGGGTPLAAGIEATTTLAAAVRRGGASPLVVMLTDGRANIARAGTPGRAQATVDALAAARAFGAAAIPALLIDTSAQPSPAARALADAMRARCVVLPQARAEILSAAVRLQRGTT